MRGRKEKKCAEAVEIGEKMSLVKMPLRSKIRQKGTYPNERGRIPTERDRSCAPRRAKGTGTGCGWYSGIYIP